nr:FAD-binding and (Fe-S)-binding domain-containing protein [Jongsikchunia kroppenstedtii]
MSEAVDSRVVDTLRGLDVEVDGSSRRLTEYSYDASNYRIRPRAVVFPRSESEVATVARWCHEHGVPLTTRGGGTGMGGNAIGAGVVLDMSRHLNRVGPVDGDMITAQAGAVLTDVRAAALAQSGGRLTFAPDPSSQNRATVGGAVGNDACGNHSVRYGRTSDHVHALHIVTIDGLRLTATRDGIRAADQSDGPAVARAAELSTRLHELATAHLAALRTELERFGRQVSGYHLARLLPENGFDVARALVGSEGTCAIVVSAELLLVPVRPTGALVCLGYRDVVAAATDVPDILPLEPAAVEGIDDTIVATMRYRRGRDAVSGLPDGSAWLFVELDDPDTATELVARLQQNGRLVDSTVVTDDAPRRALWRVREDGAGLSSRPVDATGRAAYESWPGWEDSAVPPAQLADYLRDLRALLDAHDLTGVMYGHFGAGCMHIRITFDQATAAGRRIMREFCLAAAHLVVRYGGSVSGEHGDGRARSELLPIMYSPEMIRAFIEFKTLWDPRGVLNPGSIVNPPPLDVDLALADSHADDPLSASARACIGVGRCRTSSGGVMCPSYRATRDEKDSTRARARVLQEMMRLPVVDRAADDAREALDLCLSCKACATDCPTGVDMASMKSEFLHRYYGDHRRPRSHYSLGWLPLWLKGAGLAPGAANAVGGRWALSMAGLDSRRTLPRFASRSAVRAALHGLPPLSSGTAVLFADTFTRGFRPQVLTAAAEVLGDVGGAVGGCCGLTWISTGQLDRARKVLRRTVSLLDDGTDRPIVVPEPSCASALADDLPRLLDTDDARRVAARVQTFTEAVGQRLDAGWSPGSVTDRVVTQTHCHEYAGNPLQRGKVLSRLGIGTVANAEGCCGVAGNFGFEKDHYEVSMQVAEHSLAPLLRANPGVPVLADGFSCQVAVEHLAATDPDIRPAAVVHLAELLGT